MKRISSLLTFFYKRIFPIVWYGAIIIFVIIAYPAMVHAGAEAVPVIMFPLVFAVVGYFVLKQYVFDLVDEIWDCGDALLFKNQGIGHFITLSDIINASLCLSTKPPRMTVTLRNANELGRELSFSPSM